MEEDIKQEKTHIRVFLEDENGRQIAHDRRDEFVTTVDSGFEDLSLKEDAVKINLYQNSEFILLWDQKTYKVVKRVFMPCRPVTLYLSLKEM